MHRIPSPQFEILLFEENLARSFGISGEPVYNSLQQRWTSGPLPHSDTNHPPINCRRFLSHFFEHNFYAPSGLHPHSTSRISRSQKLVAFLPHSHSLSLFPSSYSFPYIQTTTSVTEHLTHRTSYNPASEVVQNRQKQTRVSRELQSQAR